MRLVLATLMLSLAFAGTALAQSDLRAPDQQAPGRTTPAIAAPGSDDGPAAIVFVLIGLGAALLLFGGGYFAVRFRHRVAVGDDLVPQ